MSEMAPEAAPAAPVAPGGQPRKTNVLTRKIGPLPTWGWVIIVSAVLIGIAYWRSRQNSQQATTAPTGTDASQVPQFVNQTFTSVTPPTAPPPPSAAPGPIPVPVPGGDKDARGYRGKENRYLTVSGQPREWVQKRLGIKSLSWPNKYFTEAGQPRASVRRKLR